MVCVNNTTTISSSAQNNIVSTLARNIDKKPKALKKSKTTYYLALFLIANLIIVGILLCFFSHNEWWNNWMVMAPNLYMVLGALYCPLMKKNLDAQVTKQTWFYVYKGIKMALTILMLILYIAFVKQGARPFVLITAIAYLIGLVVETFCFMHYLKHHAQ